MGCSGWCAVRCGTARGASRSFSASLFSCLGCSVWHGALSRGRMVSFRPSGGGWLPRLGRPARIGTRELGRSLLDWHRICRLMIAWDGRCARMRPIVRCSRGDGPMCRGPESPSVADVSPWWGGRANVRVLGLRSSGARQQSASRGRRPATQAKPWRKRRHHEHETRGIEAH